MGFLDTGPLEILLILVVALIVWGPHKIPEIARTLGKIARALRNATYDLTSAVTKEIETEEKDRAPKPGASSDTKSNEPSDTDQIESDDT